MKLALILCLLFSIEAHAVSVLETFGVIKKGVCQDGTSIDYSIVQKIDDHHYELRIEGDEPYAYLETQQAIYDNTGRPLGIGMLYIGQKEMKLSNGFSQVFHLWRECSFSEISTDQDPKFLMATGWAVPRKLVEKVNAGQKKTIQGVGTKKSKLKKAKSKKSSP